MYVKNKKLITILFIFIILGALYFFVYMKNNSEPKAPIDTTAIQKKEEIKNIFNEIGQDALRGDASATAMQYQKLLQRSDLSEIEKLNLKLDYALALSAQGNEGVEKAYGVLHEILESQSATPAIQANAINAGLSIYYTDLNTNKLRLLLNSQFFTTKNVPNADDGLIARRIAEVANSLFPTSIGIIREAFWYGQQLRNNQKLPSDLKDAYIEKIITALDSSKKISEEQKTSSIQHYNTEVWKYTENAYRAYLLGILAVTDKKYVDDMRTEYQALFASDSKNETNIPLMQASVYSYFYYASMLKTIDPVLYKNDIDTSIERLLALIQMLETKIDSSNGEIAFVQFLQQENQRSVSNSNYIYFIGLSEYSDAFKNMLMKYGWVFSK